uniref:Uncharacterized protein n=1 Tax=Arundo donax TaxID=35708 RepID=A0A0A9BKK4_ARUDO
MEPLLSVSSNIIYRSTIPSTT